jgi:prolyl-tRNA editing enzyme YbaK/EbsC (Cys-tRNA(Pro) deacylase)
LKVESLGRADADYVKESSGYSVGGVAPIGWTSPPATTLIDEALKDYDVVWAAAGHPHAVFPTTFNELLHASNATPAKVGD